MKRYLKLQNERKQIYPNRHDEMLSIGACEKSLHSEAHIEHYYRPRSCFKELNQWCKNELTTFYCDFLLEHSNSLFTMLDQHMQHYHGVISITRDSHPAQALSRKRLGGF